MWEERISHAAGGRARTKGGPVTETIQLRRFEEVVLPHLDAAYNLARWLTGDDHDAEDVVQEAYFRAFKFFHGFRGGDGRAWVLTVVRHTCYTWLQRHRTREPVISFDEELHGSASDELNPERILLQRADSQMLRAAVEALPLEFREVLVLREMEGLSYQEIAALIEIPVGTVMSRLSRARKQLQQRLAPCMGKEE
jgi:RNA polymerase sigma-70 factor (ECF subfamily)